MFYEEVFIRLILFVFQFHCKHQCKTQLEADRAGEVWEDLCQISRFYMDQQFDESQISVFSDLKNFSHIT